MEIGTFLIGSELVNGRSKDQHMAHAIRTLTGRGLELSWCQMVCDVPDVLTRHLKQSMSTDSIVFSFGGIGCEPDDHTRACAAEAAGLRLVPNPEALRDIEAQYGDEAYPERVHMAELPQGCGLIPNGVSHCPGFSIRDHHFLPGSPQVCWPMMDWVLDNRYGDRLRAEVPVEYLISTHDAREQDLLEMMRAFVEHFPDVHFASMPHPVNGDTEMEFGVRGREAKVRMGMDWLTRELNARGYRWEAKRASHA